MSILRRHFLHFQNAHVHDRKCVDKFKSKADIEAKEKAFFSEIKNAKAEALVEKEKCHLELTKKEQKQKHRNKVSE